MKRIFSLLLGICLLSGCAGTAAETSASAETTASASASASAVLTDSERFSELYPDVPSDNVFVFADQDSLMTMLEHGTGVIYLGFPECPWCQAYAPLLNEAMQASGITRVLYYNLYADKTEDPGYYSQAAEYLETLSTDLVHYDNDGNRKVLMPLVLFVQNGTLIGYDDETCDISSDDIAPEDYWTDEKKAALLSRLEALGTQTAEAQQANDAEGCDSGCSVTG